MAGDDRLLQNELKQLWKSHVIIGIMRNQTLEYISIDLLKVLYFWFACLSYYLKMETMYLNVEEYAKSMTQIK